MRIGPALLALLLIHASPATPGTRGLTCGRVKIGVHLMAARASVPAVITELVEANWAKLEKDARWAQDRRHRTSGARARVAVRISSIMGTVHPDFARPIIKSPPLAGGPTCQVAVPYSFSSNV
jgi:hypothetical protein